MRRLVAQRFAILVPAGLVLLLAGCKRREDVDGFCGSGSVAPARNAVSVAPPGSTPREARIASLGSAGFAVVWAAGASEQDTDLFARAVSAGAVLGPERRLTQVAGRSDRPRVAVGTTSLGIAWRDDRFGRNEALAAVVGFDLMTVGPAAAFRSPQFDATQSPEPAIAALGTGFLVAWNGRGADGDDHLFAQFLGDAGAAGVAVPIVPTSLDKATAPSMAFDGATLAIVDAEERDGLASPPDVFSYVVGTAGALRETRVGQSSRATRPEVAVIGGIAGITWCDDRSGALELWFAAVDAGGVVQPDRRISPGAIGGCEHGIVAADGAFFVTWNEYLGGERIVWFRTLRPDGSADGPTWELARDTEASAADPLARPSVAWNGSTAGVVWRSTSGGAPQLFFRPLTCIAGP